MSWLQAGEEYDTDGGGQRLLYAARTVARRKLAAPRLPARQKRTPFPEEAVPSLTDRRVQNWLVCAWPQSGPDRLRAAPNRRSGASPIYQFVTVGDPLDIYEAPGPA
jgi:hypothetical protein